MDITDDISSHPMKYSDSVLYSPLLSPLNLSKSDFITVVSSVNLFCKKCQTQMNKHGHMDQADIDSATQGTQNHSRTENATLGTKKADVIPFNFGKVQTQERIFPRKSASIPIITIVEYPEVCYDFYFPAMNRPTVVAAPGGEALPAAVCEAIYTFLQLSAMSLACLFKSSFHIQHPKKGPLLMCTQGDPESCLQAALLQHCSWGGDDSPGKDPSSEATNGKPSVQGM
ncbi:hypothetical protein MG293_020714 [Ovis ammon polii]|uniref:Uncharacterized protein n=1 Tax=Ovis ammon polii TaxID=230172 RepID=A0AAD4Y0T9_OVIAM|nr:hypothetical protein MG293_020714 [Ovis ammon polii]